MKVLELFCGTKSVSKAFKSRGHEVFTIDIDPQHKPDLIKSILDLKIKEIPFSPDVIWASPPCTTFSVAGRKSNYTNFMPNNVSACLGLAYIFKTLELIEILKPKYFFIENPTGYLRKFPFLTGIKRYSITYCKYGDSRMKPTDIWTNCISWIPRKKCKNGDNCHISAPRGSKTGTQGLKDSIDRSRIPLELCNEIVKVCEGDLVIEQKCL